MATSLTLGTGPGSDGFLLHHLIYHTHWTSDDFETWQAMIKEPTTRRTRSSASATFHLLQAEQMAEPCEGRLLRVQSRLL